MSVRIGFMPGAFPSGRGAGREGAEYLRELVEVGERYGYDSLWLSDRVVGERFSPEPLIALSMVAAYSDSMKFGTSVLQLPIRNPVVLAKEMASLDYLSNGRFLPAIGLGQEDPREYQASGISKEDRGRRTDEALTVMRRLWAEDDVTHEGQFYSLRGITITPKPVQAPLPVWVGGRSRAATRRAGRVGDGWLVSSATPQEVEEGVKVVFSSAAEHGRQVDEDHIGVVLGFSLVASHKEDAGVADTGPLRSDVPLSQYSALGTPEQVVEVTKRYVEAGASKFVIRAMCSPQETVAQLEFFGREVLPHFHR